MTVNYDLVVLHLNELSSREEQVRLWTGPSDSNEISSFIEASCGLFDGSGLGDALRHKPLLLPLILQELFEELDAAMQKIDEFQGDAAIIESEQMEGVRSIATRALAAVQESEGATIFERFNQGSD